MHKIIIKLSSSFNQTMLYVTVQPIFCLVIQELTKLNEQENASGERIRMAKPLVYIDLHAANAPEGQQPSRGFFLFSHSAELGSCLLDFSSFLTCTTEDT